MFNTCAPSITSIVIFELFLLPHGRFLKHIPKYILYLFLRFAWSTFCSVIARIFNFLYYNLKIKTFCEKNLLRCILCKQTFSMKFYQHSSCILICSISCATNILLHIQNVFFLCGPECD